MLCNVKDFLKSPSATLKSYRSNNKKKNLRNIHKSLEDGEEGVGGGGPAFREC